MEDVCLLCPVQHRFESQHHQKESKQNHFIYWGSGTDIPQSQGLWESGDGFLFFFFLIIFTVCNSVCASSTLYVWRTQDN